MALSKNKRRFWAQSVGGKLKCPECGAIVTEHLDTSTVTYSCSKCDWYKEVNLDERI